MDSTIKKFKDKPRQVASSIAFVKAGQKGDKTALPTKCLLDVASDWVLSADLGKQLRFPPDIAHTNCRPDIIIVSNASRSLIVVELTVPWEDRLDESHQLKAAKYSDLIDAARSNNWKTSYFPVEVGARGFPAISLQRMFTGVGPRALATKLLNYSVMFSVIFYTHMGLCIAYIINKRAFNDQSKCPPNNPKLDWYNL